jgi:hypothetical protein
MSVLVERRYATLRLGQLLISERREGIFWRAVGELKEES